MLCDSVIDIPSRLLGRSVPCRIVRSGSGGGKWCLLLHGYGGSQDSWQETITAALAKELDMNLVMPGCGDGYYENTREPMLDFLGRELPEYLARELGFSRRREDIAAAGVSMGGFGALLVCGSFPHIYGRCASFGGAFVLESVVIWNQHVLGNASYLYFCDVFGDFDTLLGSDRDPEARALQALREGNLGPVRLLCGREDKLLEANRKLYRTLREAGAGITLQELPGDHSWDCWAPELKKILRWLAGK